MKGPLIKTIRLTGKTVNQNKTRAPFEVRAVGNIVSVVEFADRRSAQHLPVTVIFPSLQIAAYHAIGERDRKERTDTESEVQIAPCVDCESFYGDCFDVLEIQRGEKYDERKECGRAYGDFETQLLVKRFACKKLNQEYPQKHYESYRSGGKSKHQRFSDHCRLEASAKTIRSEIWVVNRSRVRYI